MLGSPSIPFRTVGRAITTPSTGAIRTLAHSRLLPTYSGTWADATPDALAEEVGIEVVSVVERPEERVAEMPGG